MTRQLRLRRARLRAGERARGWKVGFGSPAAMERLGISTPLVGFLTDRTLLEGGSTVSLEGWSSPVLEPEVAVHLGNDLRAGAGRRTVEASIAGLGAAIELVDIGPSLDPEEILASNIWHRRFVLGPVQRARAGGGADGIVARLFRNGGVVERTDDLEALTGELRDIIAHVAEVLESSGERLAEGDVVIAGSVVPALAVEVGDEVRVEIDPLGTLELSFGPGGVDSVGAPV